MPSLSRQFGDIGEQQAESFLVENGYRIKDKNYRVKNLGEIDIVGERKGKLHFFEVKTRDVKHETTFPIEFSINNKKRRNLRRVCQIYLSEHQYHPNQEWQVDALFVRSNPERFEIDLLENILWEEYY